MMAVVRFAGRYCMKRVRCMVNIFVKLLARDITLHISLRGLAKLTDGSFTFLCIMFFVNTSKT
jgi:hypothetical protein